ncbi:type I-E CRISPR-associated protein Cse2/CasB [Streptomyces sp. NPDC059698]|uniref:type I-E CRISPR-associated protein Cse2/CasB n=1 Tax=unclassified Streptomyces TaxID=2593676 RepID=UPI00093D9835|nr:type I-E CRISPR-associated protein Cse2/CasB [Streptomyces sp. CB02366]
MTTTTTSGADAPPPPPPDGEPMTERLPAPQLVARATGTYIARLERQYLADVPSAVGELARLRRGAGKRAHRIPDLWGIGGTEELAELRGGHEGFLRAEYAEEAVVLATSLWALHQQSSREHGMYNRSQNLGGAVRALIRLKGAASADEEDSPLRKRLVRVGTAESLDSVAVRLREIVLLLRGAKVPLDYARLAGQLYRWQHRPDRAGVQREWGREFHLAAVSGAKKAKAGADGGNGDAIDGTLRPDEDFGGYAAGE